MSRNGDEVIYYYALDTGIKAKYIDINTGELVSADVVIEGYEGEEYETEPVDLDDYVYLVYEGNTSGKLGETNDDVIYYYAKKTDVTVQYVDVNTNEEVDDDDKINGYEGKEYETESKDINSYILDSDSGNTEGKMARDGTTVTYFYAKECKVTIKAVDKATGEVIETTEYKGKEGDPYRVNPKEIEGFKLNEDDLPENNEGVLTEDGETVTYYYNRKVTLRVRYLDENNNPLIDDRVSEGKEGDNYKVEVTLIDGYNLQDENKVYTGTLDVKRNADGTVNTETLIEFHYKKIGEEPKPDTTIPQTSDKNFKAMAIIGAMSLVGLYAVVEAGKMLTLKKKRDDENK